MKTISAISPSLFSSRGLPVVLQLILQNDSLAMPLRYPFDGNKYHDTLGGIRLPVLVGTLPILVSRVT